MKTRIKSIELDNFIFNASGPVCTTPQELNALGQSAAGAIMIKTATFLPRAGNPKPRYKDVPLGSINSMGLPNLGYEEYIKLIPQLKQTHNKPIFLSLIGFSLNENIEMLTKLKDVEGLDAIELNLSCPNVVGKPQVAYDFEQTDHVLGEVLKVMRTSNKTFGIKLPPYFDFVHYQQMADLLKKHKPDFITCINSIGNGLIIDPVKEQPIIKPKSGFGGIGGEYIKPTALANVRKFYQLLPRDIEIIGVGGIKTGTDAFEHILCGASAVQLGTILMQEGLGAISRIQREFNELMQQKGYSSIEEFKGTLKDDIPESESY